MMESPSVSALDITPPSKLQANISKASTRDLTTLKTNMDTRLTHRGMAIYYTTQGKHQSALIYCRQLQNISQKIHKDYDDQYNQQFEERFFFRTTKAKEHLQFLLDCLIACKIFLSAKKKEDAIDMLQKIQIVEDAPATSSLPHSQNMTEKDKLILNQIHQIHCKMCAILLSAIQLAKSQKIGEYCEKFYQMYVKYVKDHYGVIQESTAVFKYANYLYQVKKFQEAQNYYKISVRIRQKNVVNSCLIDSLINLAICQKQLFKYKDAIQNTVMAIQIHKDVNPQGQIIDEYFLFLAKLYFQFGQFQQAYTNFIKCYKLRQQMDTSNPAKTQIQLNILFFLRTLKQFSQKSDKSKEGLSGDQRDMTAKEREALNVIQKITTTFQNRPQFEKYRDFKSQKHAHLSLVIQKNFFDSLSAYQVNELNCLLMNLNDLNYQRGMFQLSKCNFWQQRKTRELLLQSNPSLKYSMKK